MNGGKDAKKMEEWSPTDDAQWPGYCMVPKGVRNVFWANSDKAYCLNDSGKHEGDFTDAAGKE